MTPCLSCTSQGCWQLCTVWGPPQHCCVLPCLLSTPFTCVAGDSDITSVSQHAFVACLRINRARVRQYCCIGPVAAGSITPTSPVKLTVLGPWCTFEPFISENGTLSSTVRGILPQYCIATCCNSRRLKRTALLKIEQSMCDYCLVRGLLRQAEDDRSAPRYC